MTLVLPTELLGQILSCSDDVAVYMRIEITHRNGSTYWKYLETADFKTPRKRWSELNPTRVDLRLLPRSHGLLPTWRRIQSLHTLRLGGSPPILPVVGRTLQFLALNASPDDRPALAAAFLACPNLLGLDLSYGSLSDHSYPVLSEQKAQEMGGNATKLTLLRLNTADDTRCLYPLLKYLPSLKVLQAAVIANNDQQPKSIWAQLKAHYLSLPSTPLVAYVVGRAVCQLSELFISLDDEEAAEEVFKISTGLWWGIPIPPPLDHLMRMPLLGKNALYGAVSYKLDLGRSRRLKRLIDLGVDTFEKDPITKMCLFASYLNTGDIDDLWLAVLNHQIDHHRSRGVEVDLNQVLLMGEEPLVCGLAWRAAGLTPQTKCFLLTNNININALTSNGLNALHRTRSGRVCSELIELGVDVTHRDAQGRTTVDVRAHLRCLYPGCVVARLLGSQPSLCTAAAVAHLLPSNYLEGGNPTETLALVKQALEPTKFKDIYFDGTCRFLNSGPMFQLGTLAAILRTMGNEPIENDRGETILFHLARKSYLPCILRLGYSLDKCDKNGAPPLFHWIRANTSFVSTFLRNHRGPKPALRDPSARAAFTSTNLEAIDASGNTALIVAAQALNFVAAKEVVRHWKLGKLTHLIRHKDKEGRDALDHARAAAEKHKVTHRTKHQIRRAAWIVEAIETAFRAAV